MIFSQNEFTVILLHVNHSHLIISLFFIVNYVIIIMATSVILLPGFKRISVGEHRKSKIILIDLYILVKPITFSKNLAFF